MFKNIWIALQSWFNEDRYKTDDEKYAQELINQLVIVSDIVPSEEEGEITEQLQLDILKGLKEAWEEWKSQDRIGYNYNGWFEDKTGMMGMVERVYQDVINSSETEEDKPEDVVRTLVTRFKTIGSTLYETLVYKKELMERVSQLKSDKKELTSDKHDLLYKVRMLKERAFKQLQEMATDEQLDQIHKVREMFYGVFSCDETFKEKIFDWVKEQMNDESSRLVECESDLARRCQEIAEECINDSDSDRIYDIAREVVDEYDFDDVAYNLDLTNKDEVTEIARDLMSEEFKEHLDDYIDTDKVSNNATGISTSTVQEQMKRQLLNFLTKLTSDLSKELGNNEPTTDKPITVTEEKKEEKDA